MGKSMPKKIDQEDVVGKRYGRWTVISLSERTNPIRCRVLVKCECGVEKSINLSVLKNGKSRSCGCLKADSIRQRSNYHGLKNTPLYSVWVNMKTRCYNKKNEKFACYGGRGITVCNEWKHDFMEFRKFAIENGWNETLQIDRKNNDKGYSPKNCRFVTREININNQQVLRKSNTSGYRGVKRNKYSWVASVRINGFPHLCKAGFKTAMDAAKYRDTFIVNNGIATTLNFPNGDAGK